MANGHESTPQVAVAQLGARMHYAVPVLLHRRGYLEQLFTDAYAGPGSWLEKALALLPSSWSRGPLRRLAQRSAALPAEKVTAFNGLGVRYALALARQGSPRTYVKFSALFARRVARSDNIAPADLVYGYAGATIELMSHLAVQDPKFIVEQMLVPVSIMAPLLAAEAARWQGWETGGLESWDQETWTAREATEWERADAIAAPSLFVAESLANAGAPLHKIVLVPYAVSAKTFAVPERRYAANRPLRVLFAGTLGLRKGAPYLLQALTAFSRHDIEVRCIGTNLLSADVVARYQERIDLRGRIPRAEVIEHYRWADLLVLPSLAEGSATVTYEARAAALPIVATPNSGAWIEDGVDGFLLPIRDADALALALQTFLQKPSLVATMSRAARSKAPRFSWTAYEQRLATLVEYVHGGTLPSTPLVDQHKHILHGPVPAGAVATTG